MDRDGIVIRKVYEVVPAHIERFLTEFGRSGLPIIRSLVERNIILSRKKQLML